MKKVLVVILALMIPFAVAACKKKVDVTVDGIPVTMADGTAVTNPDGTPVTVPAQAVTNPDGEIVTYPGGIKVTQPLKVPVTDKNGELVTNPDGSPVIEDITVPVTNEQGETVTNQQGEPVTKVNPNATTTVPTQPVPGEVPSDPIISDNDPVEDKNMDFKLPYNCSETGLQIIAVNRYNGYFAEDGSNKETQGSIALTVKNTSGQYISFGQIEMKINGQDDAVFQFSYIAPNETMIVQEKNNLKYNTNDKLAYKTSMISAKTGMENGWYTGKDILRIKTESGKDTNVAITNISGKKLKGGYIYYKQKINDVVQGGITYRITIDEMVEGETLHLMAWHFNSDSVIVDVQVNE